MRTIAKTVLLVGALLVAGCATEGGARPARMSTASPSNWVGPLNPVTGNAATIIVFDNTSGSQYRSGIDRVVLSIYVDQAVTVNYQVKLPGSSTWRTLNGSGSGDAVAASTLTVLDFTVLAYNSRITVVTGVTGPTTAEVGIGLIQDRSLAM